MKLAFVTPYDSDFFSVFLHTNARLDEWRRQGIEVETFVIGDGGRLQRSALSNLVHDLRTSGHLTDGLAEFHPDLICCRWLTPVPGLVGRLRRIAPVVFEIHANDIEETAAGRPLYALYTKAFRERELRGGSGACCVTRELAGLPVFSSIPGPRGSFGNGTALTQRATPSLPLTPVIGMAVGQSQAWSGLDRFSRLAEELPEMSFVLVCPSSALANVSAAAGQSVVVRGTRSMDEYYDEVRSWTVAIGTMALERKGLTSATPLKVRDYVGLGVPTVLPYWDDDLGTVSDPLLANLAGENQASVPVEPGFLKDFASAAMGQNLRPETSARVSIEAIEARRVQFFRAVVQENAVVQAK
jgi:hypothetical protein